jgi:hypothetical protein
MRQLAKYLKNVIAKFHDSFSLIIFYAKNTILLILKCSVEHFLTQKIILVLLLKTFNAFITKSSL